VTELIETASPVNTVRKRRIASSPPLPALSPQSKTACSGWLEQRRDGLFSLRCSCCDGTERQPLHTGRAG
jgi:hypothetical protein